MRNGERLAAIGQMVTGLAHESRNALQRARGCLDLLELDLEGKPEQLNLISRIRRALADLQRNYEEVKHYAAPIMLERGSTDLAELIQTAFDELSAEFASNRVSLSIHRHGDCVVNVDSHRIRQLFRNILENAIAASPTPARIDADLRQVSAAGKRYVECKISDHGEGMSAETLTRVFEPFYTTKQSGTGLGMAICKRIVDAHEGTIQACSVPQQGTSITVRLPI
jgi:signal transduction histidine kinase